MRRLLLSIIAALAIAGGGSGCQNVARLGCEVRNFYVDVQRHVFGIDYPGDQPEFSREKYIGIPSPGHQNPCDD